jgi:putative restriction endonuclease
MARFADAVERRTPRPDLPPLENGDCLDQKTFHERYEAMPEHVRAELIGGIVFMASPQKKRHGGRQALLAHWMSEYSEHTPGVEAYLNTTSILGPKSEPEPDGCLCIEPADSNDNAYIEQAPELIGEIAATTESIDLHGKKADYEKAGVREYVVAALRSQKVFWFVLRGGKFHEMKPDADGIHRSRVLPGLWLDGDALLRRDRKTLLTALRKGLASKEHQAFVAKLAARKPPGK